MQQLRQSIGPIAWRPVIIVGTLAVSVLACAAWYSRSALPEQFSSHLSALFASHHLDIEYDEFYIEWGRAVIHTGNVKIRAADGTLLISAPHLEIDFSVRALINGWGEAVYQVYAHQPSAYLTQNHDGTWNLHHWLDALPTASDHHSPQAFHLDRVYADVVTIELTSRDGRRVTVDNGVLTLRNLRWPVGEGNTPLTLHARVGGGKLTAQLELCGSARCQDAAGKSGGWSVVTEGVRDTATETVVRDWLQ